MRAARIGMIDLEEAPERIVDDQGRGRPSDRRFLRRIGKIQRRQARHGRLRKIAAAIVGKLGRPAVAVPVEPVGNVASVERVMAGQMRSAGGRAILYVHARLRAIRICLSIVSISSLSQARP